jgi:hypothetical protein
MVLTALLNKCRYRDPTVMPAWEVLRMATVEGAQAIGLGNEVGSLEVGKQADLILVDLTTLNLSPVLTEPIRNTVLDPVLVGPCPGQTGPGQDKGGQPCPCRTRQGYRVSCPTWSTPAAGTRSRP